MIARVLPLIFALASCMISQSVIAQSMTPRIQPATPKADAIYTHANIYTGVTGASSFREVQRAQAMAVRGDRIIAVGSARF